MKLPALALRISCRRLKRDAGFAAFLAVSLGITSALAGLALAASAWLSKPLPYQSAAALYSVRVESANFAPPSDTTHASLRVAHAYAEQNPHNVARVDRQRVALTAEISSLPAAKGRLVTVDFVSANFFRVAGLAPPAGAWPRPGAGTLALVEAEAQRLFGSTRGALGRRVVLAGQPWTVSAVVRGAYLSPVALREQRGVGSRTAAIVPVDFSPRQAELARHDMGGALSLVRRVGPGDGVQVLDPASAGDFTFATKPLREVVLGDEDKAAALIVAASLVLFAAALVGAAMFTASRFSARNHERRTMEVLGGRGFSLAAPEIVECLLIACAALGVAMATIAGASYLLDGTSSTPGLDVAWMFAVAGSFAALLLAFSAILLALTSIPKLSFALGGNAGLGNRRAGALTRREASGFRALLAAQVGIGVFGVAIAAATLGKASDAMVAASGSDYDGLYGVHVTLAADAAAGNTEAALHTLAATLRRSGTVERAVLSNSSPLDLAGNNLDILMQTKGRETHYAITVIGVEPEYFVLMNQKLKFGRLFSADEFHAALATPPALDAIFRTRNPAALGSVIAPPADTSPLWHEGIRIVGAVDARRVSRLTGTSAASDLAVVYEPFRSDHIDKIAFREAWVLLKGQPPGRTLLGQWLARDVPMAQSWEIVSFRDEVRQRLKEHLLASLATVFLSVSVLLSVLMGSFAAMSFVCHRRRQEYGIRLAIGAPPRQLRRHFARRELIAPALLLVGILAAAAGWSAAGKTLEIGQWHLSMVNLAVASCVVGIAVLMGFALAFRGLQRLEPMQALRSS